MRIKHQPMNEIGTSTICTNPSSSCKVSEMSGALTAEPPLQRSALWLSTAMPYQCARNSVNRWQYQHRISSI